MALFRIDHFSDCVKVNLPLNIILPEHGKLAEKPLSNYKMLYLLHGLSDDASAWLRYTNIEYLARDLGLVVVMPSAGRSLYVDMDNGQKYFTYLTQELPTYLKAILKVNLDRENTMIAGLSMGGFGAFKAAFLHPELYFAAGSLSGLVSLNILNTPQKQVQDKELMHEFELIFGNLDRIPGSENDSQIWLQRAAANPNAYPRLYAACGLDDDLLQLNRNFMKATHEYKINLEYVEDEGKHDWYFWNKYIERFLHWALWQS